MNKMVLILVLVFSIFGCNGKGSVSHSMPNASFVEDEAQWETIKFPSGDELAITADLYVVDKTKPYILLCHQAGYSRGEYREIAVKLNELGFNCMAIDQRSGKEAKGIENETAKGAAKAKLGMTYADAEQDIIAGVDYLHKIAGKPIIIWSSSYSAALVLKVGSKNKKVSAIISFSPGEYIQGSNITKAATGISQPLFATSSREEGAGVAKLLAGANGDNKVQFIPEGKGRHGSRALWTESKGNAEYWTALKAFLSKISG
ncbi:MAG: hypothetical protein JKY52_12230 [Flavobacteriales bacterium]|nr:hypothetical protein [Flavobacteriales bacterium]